MWYLGSGGRGGGPHGEETPMKEISDRSAGDSRVLWHSDTGSAATTVVLIVVAAIVLLAVAGAVFAMTAGKAAPSSSGFDGNAFKSAMAKAGINAPAISAPVDVSKVSFSGSKKLDAEFTDAELSAMLNAVVVPTAIPVTNLSVHVHTGDASQVSGEGQYRDKWYSGWIKGPIDASGSAVSSAGNSGYGVAGVPVPLAQYKTQATQFALDVFNAHLGIVTGLRIDSVRVSEGKVKVTGAVPAKMSVTQ